MNHPGTNYFATLNSDVDICLTNKNGFAIYAQCDGNPSVVAVQPGIYATGCAMLRIDITTGNNLYYMTGSTTSPAWTLAGTGGGGGSGSSLTDTITQVAHGFTVGQIVRHQSTWVLAQGDNGADAEALGMVTTVTDANTFILTTSGFVTGLTGLVSDTQYFVDPTIAGGLTATDPSTPGQVSKPVFYAISSNTGYFINYRGEIIGTAIGVTFVNYGTTTPLTGGGNNNRLSFTGSTGASIVLLPNSGVGVGTQYIIKDLDAIAAANNITVDSRFGNSIVGTTVNQTYTMNVNGECITATLVEITPNFVWQLE